MTVPDKLFAYRVAAEMTQQQVADAIGSTVQSVSAYERGYRNPKDKTKKAYAKLFGVTIMELFYDDDEEDE